MNKQDVINRARVELGQVTLNQTTFDTEYINVMYLSCKEMLLAEYWWGFARRRLQLNETITQIIDYKYTYYYPIDCISIINIGKLPNEHRRYIDFTVFSQIINNQSVQVIATNEQPAVILDYITKEVTDNYSPYFGNALALLLAATICTAVTNNVQGELVLMQQYQQYLTKAKSFDSAQNAPYHFRSMLLDIRL